MEKQSVPKPQIAAPVETPAAAPSPQRRRSLSAIGNQTMQQMIHASGLLGAAEENVATKEENPLAPASPSLTTAAPLVQRLPTDPADSATPMPRPTFIVPNDRENLAPGQMRQKDFLAKLKTAVCQTVEEELKGTMWTALGCPYIERWFAYYETKDSQHLEQAIHKYLVLVTPITKAEDYIPLLTAKLRPGVRVWRETGAIPPDGYKALAMLPQQEQMGVQEKMNQPGGFLNRLLFKREGNGATPTADPQQVRAQLNGGERLNGRVKSQMESAFGVDFSGVRIHQDATAGRVAKGLRARAFTVGQDIAFGSGQYRPGTLIGDGLLAHELAHVVQQRQAGPQTTPSAKGMNPPEPALEADANRSAQQVVASMWQAAGQVKSQMQPRLESGLQLQRCPDADSPEFKDSVLKVETELLLEEFTKIQTRRENMLTGKEPFDVAELDKMNTRLTQIVEELKLLGVKVDKDTLYQALKDKKDVLQVTGKLITLSSETPFYGQRLGLQALLDYTPPGRSIKVGWRWRTAGSSDEFQFLRTGKRTSDLKLELDEAFWNLVDKSKTHHAGGVEVLAHIFLGDEKTAVTTLKKTLKFTPDVPSSLSLDVSIGGLSRQYLIKGQRAKIMIREWVPPRRDHSLDWYVDGKKVATDYALLNHTFNTTGESTVTARLHTVRRSFGIHDKTLIRVISTTIKVLDMQKAGEESLKGMPAAKLPSVATLETSLQTSIAEIKKRKDLGGEQASYWKSRLESQEKRLRKLREFIPDISKQQALPAEASAADETKLDKTLSYAGPVPAVLVVPEGGGVQPLNIYLTIENKNSKWYARLIDVTGADVYNFNEGSGYTTPLEAYKGAFKYWKSENPYPKGGKVVYQFSPPGWTLDNSFSTTTTWKKAKAWVDGILTVGAIVVAGLLLMAPEATVTKWAGMALLAASVARSGVAIYENINLGMDPLDSRNILEAISILGSFLGIGGGVMRQAGMQLVRPTMFRVGNWFILAAVGADVGTMVLVTAQAIEMMRAIESDPTLDEGQRVARLSQLTATLILQGAMLFVSNREFFRKGARLSDFVRLNKPGATASKVSAGGGEVKLGVGERLDIGLELRRAGGVTERLRPPGSGEKAQPGQPEPPPPYGDMELAERFFSLQWMKQGGLSSTQTEPLLRQLSTEALVGLRDIDAVKAKAMFDKFTDKSVINALAPVMKGSKLESLTTAVGADKVQALHQKFETAGLVNLVDTVGNTKIKKLLTDLTPTELKELSDKLGNPTLAKLTDAYTGKELKTAVETMGKDIVVWAGKDVGGVQAKELLDNLSKDALTNLMNIPSDKAHALYNKVGKDTLEKALTGLATDPVQGTHLQAMLDTLGDKTTKEMLDYLVSGGASRLKRIRNIGENLETGQSGVLSSPTALGTQSIIVDSNALIAIELLMKPTQTWKALPEVRKKAINAIREQMGLPALTTDPPDKTLASIVGGADLRVANVVHGETGKIAGVDTSGLKLTVDRNDAAYKDVIDKLKNPPSSGDSIGGNKGHGDRAAVADALFAQTSGGTPRFVTRDTDVYVRLYRYFKPTSGLDIPALKTKHGLKASVADTVALQAEFPNGFNVVINGKTLFVVPVYP